MGGLVRDLIIILFSIILAVIFVQTGLLDGFSHKFKDAFLVASLFAGLLFTSAFTAAIGIAAFIVLGSEGYNPFLIAGFGAIGSVVGDSLIYRFVRDDIVEDVNFFMKRVNKKSYRHVVHSKIFYWVVPMIGALIIASPLPDELGVGLLALTRLPQKYFYIASYTLNFIGILAIVMIGEVV